MSYKSFRNASETVAPVEASEETWELSLWDGEGRYEYLYVKGESEAKRLADFLNAQEPESYGWNYSPYVAPVPMESVDAYIAELQEEERRREIIKAYNAEYDAQAKPIYARTELEDWEQSLLERTGRSVESYLEEERDYDAENKARWDWMEAKGYLKVTHSVNGNFLMTSYEYLYPEA